MNENAQILAFADQLIQEINDAQLEIELLEKVAKFRKDAFAAKIDSELANDVEKSQALINEKKAMLLPIIQKQLEGKNKKSIKLLSGSAGFKKSPAKFTICGQKVDGKSEQLLEIVKNHNLNNYIITKEFVDWSNLKKTLNVANDGVVISEDGEVLQNIEAEPETDVFYVKAN